MHDLHPEESIAAAVKRKRADAKQYGRDLSAATDTDLLAEICAEWLAKQPIESGWLPPKMPSHDGRAVRKGNTLS